MGDFLEDKKQEIQARLKELKPVVSEYYRLEAGAQALEGVLASSDGSTATATRPRAGTSRQRRTGSISRLAGTGQRGRPKGSGHRSPQALRLVRKYPGITIQELADKMKIKQNYLYRVLPALAQDGLVEKGTDPDNPKGWYPKDVPTGN